ncbi:hypothetical protein CBS101457_002630 [Exobasidium rhododendri]|nr:hypothetical protein CBS101457_002630 [Exobasidium rhododendri]
MRPERTKRPRTAADGTILSSTPVGKKPRLEASPVTPSQDTTPKKAAVKKKGSEVNALPASEDSDSDGEDLASEAGTPASKRISSKSSLDSPLSLLDGETLSKYLPGARNRVLSVLAGQLPPSGLDKDDQYDGSECVGLQDQWQGLRSAVKGTLQGEGNSALLVGSRGSGKSLLLDSVLRSVVEQGQEASKTYHLVRLDGAIQSTDRLSMRELARQLVRKGAIKMPKEGEEGALDFRLDGDDDEMANIEEEEDEVDPPSNEAAETLGEEEEDEERRAVTNAVLSSLSNTTSTILTLLSTGSNSKKSLPLIITLSSFDLYTSRPRQALLYVLLDAVQAGSYTPGLCVVGMTSRLDTSNLLEKRVKSRFGGRIINIWPENVWVSVMKRTLLHGLCQQSDREGEAFDEAWKGEIKSICADKKVLNMLEDFKSTSNVVRTLYKTIYPIVASVSLESPALVAAFAEFSDSLLKLSSSYNVLSDLTTPEFALLIASKQLRNRDREIFNFEMCFDELKRFVGRIEMDRLGAATTAPSSAFSTPDNNISKRRGAGATAGISLGWQGLTDRKRVMMAYRSLLQLEIFQPEATLNTLSMGAPIATTTFATAQKAAGQTVRTEFQRVKCTIFPQDIVLAAKAKNRKEAIGVHLVQWATSQS